MDANTYFKLQRLLYRLRDQFEDTDPGHVDHEFFSASVNSAFEKSTSAELFFEKLIEVIKQQKDLNLTDSRAAVNKALAAAKTEQTNKENGSVTPSLKNINISEYSWKLDTGQLMLLASNGVSTAEEYQHLLFDLAVNQNASLLSFIEKDKHDKIFKTLIKELQKAEGQTALKFNTKLVQLKSSRSFVDQSVYFSNADFEAQISYLKTKYQLDVIYLDDYSILKEIISEESSKSYQLFLLGDFLLHLANKYKLRFIINYHHDHFEVKSLKSEIGRLINYTAQAIAFQKYEFQHSLKVPFFEIIDLKSSAIKPIDAYFDLKECLILKTTNKNEI
jgi:hypothetical protein